jgi:hypothetical protein
VLYGAGNGTDSQEPLKNRTLANCAPGDPVISLDEMKDSRISTGRVSYNDKGTIWDDRSSKCLMAAFTGELLGERLIKLPTDSL